MLIIAHRGASAKELENTRAAFKLARELGADGVELDVHATKDGEIVVHHDPLINGIAISETVGADVRESVLQNGETVPTLQETLDILGPECIVFVELKSLPATFDDDLLSILHRGPNPANCRIHSFDHRIVRRIREKDPTFPGGILSTSYPVYPAEQIKQAGASALWQQDAMVDNDLVDTVHNHGFEVYVWTVDDETRAVELRDIGVDGICTNTPDVIRRAVQR